MQSIGKIRNENIIINMTWDNANFGVFYCRLMQFLPMVQEQFKKEKIFILKFIIQPMSVLKQSDNVEFEDYSPEIKNSHWTLHNPEVLNTASCSTRIYTISHCRRIRHTITNITLCLHCQSRTQAKPEQNVIQLPHHTNKRKQTKMNFQSPHNCRLGNTKYLCI